MQQIHSFTSAMRFISPKRHVVWRSVLVTVLNFTEVINEMTNTLLELSFSSQQSWQTNFAEYTMKNCYRRATECVVFGREDTAFTSVMISCSFYNGKWRRFFSSTIKYTDRVNDPKVPRLARAPVFLMSRVVTAFKCRKLAWSTLSNLVGLV